MIFPQVSFSAVGEQVLPDLQLSEWSTQEDGLTAEREEWFWGAGPLAHSLG